MRPLISSPPELQPLASEVRARLRDLENEFRRSKGLVTDGTPTLARPAGRALRGDR